MPISIEPTPELLDDRERQMSCQFLLPGIAIPERRAEPDHVVVSTKLLLAVRGISNATDHLAKLEFLGELATELAKVGNESFGAGD